MQGTGEEIFTHAKSGDTIIGRRVQPGEALEETDVYDSMTGKWESCACPGLTLALSAPATWVRPARCRSCGGSGKNCTNPHCDHPGHYCGACNGSGKEQPRGKVPA